MGVAAVATSTSCLRAEPALRTAVARSGSEDVTGTWSGIRGSSRRGPSLRRRAQAAVRRGGLPESVPRAAAGGAPIAIWLGLLLDGIPESLVIGATAGALRVSFIVGDLPLQLPGEPGELGRHAGAGLPVADRRRPVGNGDPGHRRRRGVGSVVFQQAPVEAFAVVEGLAAGAMLTVITQTMMPEALHRSGGFVGLAALAGFLVTTLVGV